MKVGDQIKRDLPLSGRNAGTLLKMGLRLPKAKNKEEKMNRKMLYQPAGHQHGSRRYRRRRPGLVHL